MTSSVQRLLSYGSGGILLLLVVAFRPLAVETDPSLEAWPEHFPAPVYKVLETPLEQAKVDLGRMLFYDPVLSADSSISCASCHSPYNAFAHTDHDLSHGIADSVGMRNAPALFNLAWAPTFMWDGAVNHLDVQALAPITHPGEMGEDMAHVVSKLQRNPRYPKRFEAAFGTAEVTGQHLLLALAQFQLTLVSADAKYDSVQRGEAAFSTQEAHGYDLYRQHCSSCHTEPLFTNYSFVNNGLPPDSTLNDAGRAMQTMEASDSLLFKVPSLRNLSYSFPYMHDGRFRSLHQVLNHYTDGIHQSKTLAAQLKNGILLSPEEKADMVAFLLTLNDLRFVFNPENKFPQTFFQ